MADSLAYLELVFFTLRFEEGSGLLDEVLSLLLLYIKIQKQVL